MGSCNLMLIIWGKRSSRERRGERVYPFTLDVYASICIIVRSTGLTVKRCLRAHRSRRDVAPDETSPFGGGETRPLSTILRREACGDIVLGSKGGPSPKFSMAYCSLLLLLKLEGFDSEGARKKLALTCAEDLYLPPGPFDLRCYVGHPCW